MKIKKLNRQRFRKNNHNKMVIFKFFKNNIIKSYVYKFFTYLIKTCTLMYVGTYLTLWIIYKEKKIHRLERCRYG